MKHNSDVPGQLALFAIAPTFERTTIHNPYWDEIETNPQNSHSVGGQIRESDFQYKSVGEQVTTDTLKTAPQHDTHWVERYWVQRSGNKYWYFRYCWMMGRKIHRIYLGSVSSILAKRKKADIEVWIADGKLPFEIEKLIRGWKNDYPPTMSKVLGNASFQTR